MLDSKTRRGFKRAAPSGGELYALDVYAVVGKGCVDGLAPKEFLDR